MRPDFPLVIDNSLLDRFRSCPQACFQEYFHHWKSKAPSVHLHAGKAFAHGLEIARTLFYNQEQAEPVCMTRGLKALLESYGNFPCPPESPKSAERMAQAFEFYLSGEWGLGRDRARPARMPSGRHAIEFSFAEPLQISHPQTQQPIIYAGRADMIVELNGGLFVVDDKTATRLGGQWADQWEMRAQFSGYSWAARNQGWKVDGVLVRGVAILKNEFKRAQHITYRPQWEIDRWLEQTHADVKRLVAAWTSGQWDYNMGEACVSKFGTCQFLKVCKHPTPGEWMPTMFERRIWDPVKREETVL